MSYSRAGSNTSSSTDYDSEAEYDSEEERLDEAFKSKNFKSDTSVMICPSKGKLTAHGIVSTPCDTNMEVRHLKAVLTLPDLKERASMSSMEGLYELSQKLVVTSPRLLARRGLADPKETLDQSQQPEKITDHEKDQQHEEEVTGQEMIQQLEVIDDNSTLKQHQEVIPEKVFVRLPIYSSWSRIIHRKKTRRNKTCRKTISKAYVEAYNSRKLNSYVCNQPATKEVRAYKKVIKFLTRIVLSDTFKAIMLVVFLCLIFIFFYDIEDSVEEAYL